MGIGLQQLVYSWAAAKRRNLSLYTTLLLVQMSVSKVPGPTL